MLKRLLTPLVLAALLALPAVASAAEAKAPTLLVRVPSVDDLMASARKVAAEADQEELFKQAEGVLKAMTGPKGIEGLDPKRPVGAYGQLTPDLVSSALVGLLPVADEKTVLEFIERNFGKPDQDKDGIYSLTPEGLPMPLYFCFANDYLYVSNSAKALAKDELLAPKPLLAVEPGVLASVQLNFEGIPERVRDTIIEELGKGLANEKNKQKEGESKADEAFRHALLDEIGDLAGQLLKDGRDLSARVTVDPKSADLSLQAQLTPRKETTLARRVADLEMKSVLGTLPGKESSLVGQVNLMLTERLRKVLATVLDEQLTKARDNQPDDAGKALVDALAPTLKAAYLDAVLDVQGPSAEKKQYTAVLAGRVKDGLAIEKALREAYKTFKPEQKLILSLDADKADKLAVHRINIGVFYDDNLKTMFGETPVYLVLRDDAVFLSFGEEGLKAIKEATTAKEAVVSPLKVRGSFAKLAPVLALGNPKVAEAAKTVFAKGPGRDQAELTLTGGKTLQLRLNVQATVLRFLALSAPDQEKKDQ